MQSRVKSSQAIRSSRSACLSGEDRELIEALRVFLRHNGWDTTVVADSSHAIAECKRADPDVVFVQGRLDDFDTIEMLVGFRALKEAPRVVLCLDELDSEAEQFAKHDLGVRTVILRPCSFEEIVAAIEEGERSQSGTVRVAPGKVIEAGTGGGR